MSCGYRGLTFWVVGSGWWARTLPAGLYVGPKYTRTYDQESGPWSIEDVGDAGSDEGTDKDFVALRTGQPRPESG